MGMDCIFAIHQLNLTKTLATACKTLQDIFTKFQTETDPERVRGDENVHHSNKGRNLHRMCRMGARNEQPVSMRGKTYYQCTTVGEHNASVSERESTLAASNAEKHNREIQNITSRFF